MKTDKKIISYSDLEALRKRCSNDGKTIVFTSGCYDIMHLGHVMHFNFCKSKGDVLLVSLGNDKTLRELKGPSRPINSETFRARMLAALEQVDYVVISEESGFMDHSRMVEILRPDYYVVPSTDKNLSLKKSLSEVNGGKLIVCKRLPPEHLKGGISVTKILEKINKI